MSFSSPSPSPSPPGRQNTPPSSKLVVFFAGEGPTKTIGLRIAEHLLADVLEVTEDGCSTFPSPSPPSPNGRRLSITKWMYRSKEKAPIPQKVSIAPLDYYFTVYVGAPVFVHYRSGITVPGICYCVSLQSLVIREQSTTA